MPASKPFAKPPATPQSGEIWYVRHLWEDKARFGACIQADRIHIGLREHDGYACVPYKSRPVIVLYAVGINAGDDQRFDVVPLTSKSGDRRIKLGTLDGLEGESYFYQRAPIRVYRTFLGVRRGKVDAHTRKNIVETIQKYLGRARTPETAGPMNLVADTLDSVLPTDEDTQA